MKILLISDTHGEVDLINQYAEETSAELCFHLGDWGMYLPENISLRSHKELRLLVKQ